MQESLFHHRLHIETLPLSSGRVCFHLLMLQSSQESLLDCRDQRDNLPRFCEQKPTYLLMLCINKEERFRLQACLNIRSQAAGSTIFHHQVLLLKSEYLLLSDSFFPRRQNGLSNRCFSSLRALLRT